MDKKWALLSAFWMLIAFTQAPRAWAERESHRPWFSHAAAPPADSADSVAPSVKPPAVRPAARTAHKPYGSRTAAERASSSTGQKVVNQAMKYKGTKYRFGGTNKKGIDCSGLVMRVYHDVKSWQLPRTSEAMFHKGQPVKQSDLRPGDLVFFKNTYKHGISHVGIYAGSDKFIHARNRRFGVTVSKLSDPYFQLHYAGARRVI